MKLTTAYCPGRYQTIQRGHVAFFKWLLSKFDRLIIGLGRCYEIGEGQQPFPAFLRQAIIERSLYNKGVNMHRITFVHLQDFHDHDKEKAWDNW